MSRRTSAPRPQIGDPASIRTTRGLLPNKHFTIRRVIGRGDLWVTEYVISYDGKPSHTVSIMEFRDGKVFRETQYFGDPFEPWSGRARWVEPIPDLVWSPVLSPDGHWLVSYLGINGEGPFGGDPGLLAWHLTERSGGAVPDPIVVMGHESLIMAVTMSPDSRWMVTEGNRGGYAGTFDNTARLWDLSL